MKTFSRTPKPVKIFQSESKAALCKAVSFREKKISSFHGLQAVRISVHHGTISSVSGPLRPLVTENSVLLAINLRLWHHQAGVVLRAPVFDVWKRPMHVKKTTNSIFQSKYPTPNLVTYCILAVVPFSPVHPCCPVLCTWFSFLLLFVCSWTCQNNNRYDLFKHSNICNWIQIFLLIKLHFPCKTFTEVSKVRKGRN